VGVTSRDEEQDTKQQQEKERARHEQPPAADSVDDAARTGVNPDDEGRLGEQEGPGGTEGGEDQAAAAAEAALALAEERYQQLLRLTADFENFRRRVDRDREEQRAAVARGLLVALLPAYDNLERALKAVPPADDLKGLRQGLEMTRRSFVDGLASQGVDKVPTVGQVFDPAVHEAIQTSPAPEPEGTVLEEYQAGFRWGERLLRAALVRVSAGPTGDDAREVGEGELG
jgi:molecular chaperone GrpE